MRKILLLAALIPLLVSCEFAPVPVEPDPGPVEIVWHDHSVDLILNESARRCHEAMMATVETSSILPCSASTDDQIRYVRKADRDTFAFYAADMKDVLGCITLDQTRYRSDLESGTVLTIGNEDVDYVAGNPVYSTGINAQPGDWFYVYDMETNANEIRIKQ